MTEAWISSETDPADYWKNVYKKMLEYLNSRSQNLWIVSRDHHPIMTPFVLLQSLNKLIYVWNSIKNIW